MWQCRKCGKPVFFAERKQSLGFDWHPNCLRCEECEKRLNPGQHAEHKGVPYCHHPCYGALFGPQLFGHGTRNECHTSFGKLENKDGGIKRSHLETCLKTYNQFYEGKPAELKSREANGRLILEGVLRIYWGVRKTIHLKEEDDNRIFARPQSLIHVSNFSISDSDEEFPLNDSSNLINSGNLATPKALHNTIPSHRLTSERENNSKNGRNNSLSPPIHYGGLDVSPTLKTNTALVRRRAMRVSDKTRLKRRCSINGHIYLRETSSFTPPFGSPCSLWVTSKTTCEEVLNMLLEKYKVEMSASNFALFIVRDNGEQRRVKEVESPLITRVVLGPHENISKIFIMDAQKTLEISTEVAQFLNLSLVECRAILLKYEQEELNQITDIRHRYSEMRHYMEKLKKDRGIGSIY